MGLGPFMEGLTWLHDQINQQGSYCYNSTTNASIRRQIDRSVMETAFVTEAVLRQLARLADGIIDLVAVVPDRVETMVTQGPNALMVQDVQGLAAGLRQTATAVASGDIDAIGDALFDIGSSLLGGAKFAQAQAARAAAARLAQLADEAAAARAAVKVETAAATAAKAVDDAPTAPKPCGTTCETGATRPTEQGWDARGRFMAKCPAMSHRVRSQSRRCGMRLRKSRVGACKEEGLRHRSHRPGSGVRWRSHFAKWPKHRYRGKIWFGNARHLPAAV